MLRLSAIGDVCNAQAAALAILRQHPDTTVTWVINRTEASLLEGTEGCEFIIFDKRAGVAAYRHVWRELSGRRFDALLLMHASMRANVLSVGIKAKRRIGFDRARARDFQTLFSQERIARQPDPHVVDGFMQFVRHIGIATQEPQWDIPLSADDRAFAEQRRQAGRPLLVVSPCSSDRRNNFRNWPRDRFADACRYSVERHNAVVVVSGAGTTVEHDYAARIVAACGDAAQSVVGQTSLKQLYALIDAADLVIAPDSAAVHLASASRTALVGLYATSNPDRTGPYRGRDGLVNVYPDAVKQFLGQSVDAVRWGQRVRDPAALELISVEAVCERIDQLLSRNVA
ncbi:MAG: glycosyltransferase family 9 protein [Pseudomonadota bacterium]